MSNTATVNLGGSASSVTIGKVGHGLMMMSMGTKVKSDQELFETIKSGVDTLPLGVRLFLNSGEFYARDHGTGNLELLARFFGKYPEYAERTFLSVKGGKSSDPSLTISSPENLRRSVDTILSALRGTKKLDLFECARVDSKIPVEAAMKNMLALVAEGKFDHIGLSECSAATVRRAAAAAPIAAVEIEISPLSYEEETKNVLTATKELGIAVIAYSPVAHGFMSASIAKPDDLPVGDIRHAMTRFKPEALKHNLNIVEALKEIAAEKQITPAQLSIAWVGALGAHVIPLPGSTDTGRNLENLAAGNVKLSDADVRRIAQVADEHGVKGDRYFGAPPQVSGLWG